MCNMKGVNFIKKKKGIKKGLAIIFVYFLVFMYCFMLSDTVERLEVKEMNDNYNVVMKIDK